MPSPPESPSHYYNGGNSPYLRTQRKGYFKDDETEASPANFAGRVHRIRRKLNPLGNKARWRYRIEGGRIDEEDTNEIMEEESQCEATRNIDESFVDEVDMSDEGKTGFSPLFASTGVLPVVEPPDWTLRRASSNHQYTPTKKTPRNVNFSRAVTFDTDFVTGTSSPGSHGGSEGIPVRFFRSDHLEFRVKPHHCFPEPVYMTESEIYEQMIKSSQNVEFLQSYIAPSTKGTKLKEVPNVVQSMWGTPCDGRVGSLRVEVLGCVGLASVKPDVAVYLTCGDVAFVTDVIHSCRSPMWPCNSKRAAVFPIHHAYVQLHAGVFATKKENDYFCGRVVLDLACLRPDTEYDATLPLRASSFVYDRRPRGVLRLRFSLHWFSERAAILSYLKSPSTLVHTSCKDNPSIPCGDPKTFRNVALTVHGQDLPGKYTRKAFRATRREFNLCSVNLRFLVKSMVSDAMLYEKPLVSLYLFVAWMHCVYADSVKLAPAYFVGYLICNLIDNYTKYNVDPASHLGYAPPTFQELLKSLLADSDPGNTHPLMVVKKARSHPNFKSKRPENNDDVENVDDDIEPRDHREFPFSERFEYRKFSAEDALAPRKKSATKVGDQKIMRHLSIYVKDHGLGAHSVSGGSFDDDDEDDDSDRYDGEFNDNETVQGDVDNVSSSEADDDDDITQSEQMHVIRSSSSMRRLPIGPPQDTDVRPKKNIPPQVILARAESQLHKITGFLTMDKIYHSSLSLRLSRCAVEEEEEKEPTGDTTLPSSAPAKKKRLPLDEFDRRLGLRSRHPNPVTEIESLFLGPLMRILRIFVLGTRMCFNVGIWKDPILSFWCLCFLVLLMCILLIFPWRAFMFLIGLLCFGPQNILVRRRLERNASLQEEMSAVKEHERDLDQLKVLPDTPTKPGEMNLEKSKGKGATRRRRLQDRLAQIKGRKRVKKVESTGQSLPDTLPNIAVNPNRPPFIAVKSAKTQKLLEPREVVVPYSRFRKERFYDWPPDPTVARATPVALEGCVIEDIFIPKLNDESETSLRRRHSSEI